MGSLGFNFPSLAYTPYSSVILALGQESLVQSPAFPRYKVPGSSNPKLNSSQNLVLVLSIFQPTIVVKRVGILFGLFLGKSWHKTP